MKLVASMEIKNEAERKAIMSWVRQVANGGYSEDGDTVHLTYTKGKDEDDDGRWHGIIHVVEGYAEHSIETTGD